MPLFANLVIFIFSKKIVKGYQVRLLKGAKNISRTLYFWNVAFFFAIFPLLELLFMTVFVQCVGVHVCVYVGFCDIITLLTPNRHPFKR